MTRSMAINWTTDEALAIRSLLRDPNHQKAVELILRKACGLGNMPFIPGSEGQRETDYNLGRLAVGLTLAQLGQDEVGKRIARKHQQAKEANE